MILPYCTERKFDALTSHVVLRGPMRLAVRAVLVKRMTWADASKRHKVTQSGMLKAMRRIRSNVTHDPGWDVSTVSPYRMTQAAPNP